MHPTAAGGEDVVQGGQAPSLHNYPPSTPFTLLAHPERWDVFLTTKGPEILPVLKRLPHQPGVAGVEQLQDSSGRIWGNPMRAIAAKRALGWVEIASSTQVVAFGQTYTGYVHRYRGNRGFIHLERWTRLYKVGTSTHEAQDRDGYHEFLRQVRNQLLGGGPDAGVLAGMEASLRRDHGRARVGAVKSPGAAAAVELLADKLKAFLRPKAAIYRVGQEVPPDVSMGAEEMPMELSLSPGSATMSSPASLGDLVAPGPTPARKRG